MYRTATNQSGNRTQKSLSVEEDSEGLNGRFNNMAM